MEEVLKMSSKERGRKGIFEMVKQGCLKLGKIRLPRFFVIKSCWLNPKQIIIDVGIHRTIDGSNCGDVDFNLVKDKVSWITPVPGGVGPMTISALLQNTLTAFKLQNNIPLNK